MTERLDDIEAKLETDEPGRDVPEDSEELLKLRSLYDEDFLRQYGADLALDAWGARQPRAGGLGYDEFRERPLGARLRNLQGPRRVSGGDVERGRRHR